MKLLECFEAMNAAVAEARERGATDAEVAEIRRSIREQYGRDAGQEYPNQWVPPPSIPDDDWNATRKDFA